MSENDYILTIIAKQLKGLASAGELEQLQQWLQATTANQHQYDELLTIWRRSESLLTGQAFDTTSAWQKIEGQLHPVTAAAARSKPAPIVSLFTKRVAVAAILLVVFAAALFWFTDSRLETFTATTANELLILPDKSTVHVRKGSQLSYPATFSAEERLVKLKGEAFFEVTPNAAQPFRIHTAHSTIQVLGTSFLVHNNDKADEVVVVTGKVQVQDAHNRQQVVVPAGQRVLLLQHQFVQQAVTDSNFIAWRTGHLDFDNTPLPKALEEVAHYYGEAVELDRAASTTAATLRITVRFEHQPLEQAMEEIGLITGLTVKKENGKMILYQK